MRYLMKQNLFCFGDDFTIQDESGQDAFFVDGKAFCFGDKLSFQDMSGNELAFIQQKVFSWGANYEIYRGGELAAVVKKEHFTFFNCKVLVDVPGPDDLEAEGDFTDRTYRFSRNGCEVAEVSKRWFSMRDSYGVEVLDSEDAVLILASTVVIDMVCHDHRKWPFQSAKLGDNIRVDQVTTHKATSLGRSRWRSKSPGGSPGVACGMVSK
jgi:uncharacterized protein YxjI